MTASADPAGRPPWFHGWAAARCGGTTSEEARRRQELAEAGEVFRRHLRALEGGRRQPRPEPGVAPSFWSPTPVLGFRLWYVFSARLQGLRQTWPRPELKAGCERRGPGAPHLEGGCRCGIYALKAPEGLIGPGGVRRRPGAGIAFGLVALSGVVVEHERGYRAARAEAAAMVVVHRGGALGGDDRWWIKRLFQRPAAALREAEAGVWPRVKAIHPGADEIVGFLCDEARRFEQTWTSVSRSA